jgi:hypothetical protein
MHRTDTSRIRKRLLGEQSSMPPDMLGEIDIAAAPLSHIHLKTRITLSST